MSSDSSSSSSHKRCSKALHLLLFLLLWRLKCHRLSRLWRSNSSSSRGVWQQVEASWRLCSKLIALQQHQLLSQSLNKMPRCADLKLCMYLLPQAPHGYGAPF